MLDLTEKWIRLNGQTFKLVKRRAKRDYLCDSCKLSIGSSQHRMVTEGGGMFCYVGLPRVHNTEECIEEYAARHPYQPVTIDPMWTPKIQETKT